MKSIIGAAIACGVTFTATSAFAGEILAGGIRFGGTAGAANLSQFTEEKIIGSPIIRIYDAEMGIVCYYTASDFHKAGATPPSAISCVPMTVLWGK